MKKILVGLLMLLSGQAFAQDSIRVACVGNSITEGPGRNHPNSYPMQLQSMLGKGFLVKNFGVSGSTLLKKGDKPYWEEKQFDSAKSFKADILILKMGTNDTKPQNWKYKNDFTQDYVELIETFKPTMAESSRIFICLPAPVFNDQWGITSSILQDEIIPALKEIAKKTGAEIVDLNTVIKDQPNLFPDGIHPDTEGNRVMAETIAPYIKGLNP
jgi:acyl-CoA thioesterase-1